MSSFNKVILMGNITRDPVLSYLPSQTPVVEVGLATNRKFKGNDGQQREEVCFVDCSAFGKMAETIAQYCKKGDPLLIEGRLKLDTWEAQDGSKRSKLRVVIESFTFVGGGTDQRSQDAAEDGRRDQQTKDACAAAGNPQDDTIPF